MDYATERPLSIPTKLELMAKVCDAVNHAHQRGILHRDLKPGNKAGLRFINADVLARELNADPYAAARVADSLRRQFVAQPESFVFETVFPIPPATNLLFSCRRMTLATTQSCDSSGSQGQTSRSNA